jgi:hypothetical protein
VLALPNVPATRRTPIGRQRCHKDLDRSDAPASICAAGGCHDQAGPGPTNLSSIHRPARRRGAMAPRGHRSGRARHHHVRLVPASEQYVLLETSGRGDEAVELTTDLPARWPPAAKLERSDPATTISARRGGSEVWSPWTKCRDG